MADSVRQPVEKPSTYTLTEALLFLAFMIAPAWELEDDILSVLHKHYGDNRHGRRDKLFCALVQKPKPDIREACDSLTKAVQARIIV